MVRRPELFGGCALLFTLLVSFPAVAQEVGRDDFPLTERGPGGGDLFDARRPAAAYNPLDDELLVVWYGSVDGNRFEWEVLGQRLDAATGEQVGDDDFRISDFGPPGVAGWKAVSPAVAYNPIRHEYLVVWSALDPDGSEQIWVRRLAGATGEPVRPARRISGTADPGTSDLVFDWEASPAVVHNPLRDEYLVVWPGEDVPPLAEDEREIFGQLLDGFGREVGADDFRISQMGEDGDPEVEASCPDVAYNSIDDQYLVVWEGNEEVGGNFNQEVFGQLLDAGGNGIGADDFRITDVGPGDGQADGCFDPAVVHNPVADQYLVVCRGNDGQALKYQVYGQRLDAGGVAVGEDDFQISEIPGSSPNGVSTHADAAYDPRVDLYVVVWSADPEFPVSYDFEIYGQKLEGASGRQVGSDDFPVSDIGEHDGGKWPAVVHVAEHDEWLVVFESEPAYNEEEIHAQRLLAPLGPGGSVFGVAPEQAFCGAPSSTGRRPVPIDPGESTSWSCALAGLDPAPGTLMAVGGWGAVTTPPVGGTAVGLDLRRVTCSNETTGQSLHFDPAGAVVWDCEAEGLVVGVGDRVLQVAAGTVSP